MANSTTGIIRLNGARQPHVLHGGLQVREAVLEREAPLERMRMLLDVDVTPSSLTVVVLARDGKPTPTSPVTAIGRRYFSLPEDRRSPCRRTMPGVNVLNDSGDALRAGATDVHVDAGGQDSFVLFVLADWYLTLASRLSKPFVCVAALGCGAALEVVPNPMPRSGVMRLISRLSTSFAA